MSDLSQSYKVEDSLGFFESDLFREVQMSGIFEDSKTFADATPTQPLAEIYSKYKSQRVLASFELSVFVHQYFSLPQPISLSNVETAFTVLEYIESLWPKLEKQPDPPSRCSLLPLNHPYIVPGGRFREIYYWDSYFTALGLSDSGRLSLARSMVDNFIQLQSNLGCIPNGNRSYYRTRSQPPVLSLMIELILGSKGEALHQHNNEELSYYLDALLKEYQFWMDGRDKLGPDSKAYRRVVLLPNGAVLNRYWDDSPTPRPESYREDIEAAASLPEAERAEFYRHIRAACESGWDFSSRWLGNPNELCSIRTTDTVPVDLNCLLYNLESILAELFEATGEHQKAHEYELLAKTRGEAINLFLWDQESNIFCDYLLSENRPTPVRSLACVLPLFVGIANQAQANMISEKIKGDFLVEGGLITTLSASHQQWDSPNGWAPLHWFAVMGLRNYQFTDLARTIMQRWNNTVELYYLEHDNVMEKYNVRDVHSMAVGGEYEVQHGFGWTNGVTLAFSKMLGDPIVWPHRRYPYKI